MGERDRPTESGSERRTTRERERETDRQTESGRDVQTDRKQEREITEVRCCASSTAFISSSIFYFYLSIYVDMYIVTIRKYERLKRI